MAMIQLYHRCTAKVGVFEKFSKYFEYQPSNQSAFSVDPLQPLGYDPDAPKRYNYSIMLYSLKLVEVNEPAEKVAVVMEIMEVIFCV